jgi:hypothetical protein
MPRTSATRHANRALILIVAVIWAGASVQSTSAAAAKISSAYVSLTEQDCIVIDAPKEGEEGGDWSLSRCGRPAGGWKVYVEYGDAREDILLERNGVRTALKLNQFHSSFSVVGPALEFRLRNGVPFAAVVRHIHENPEDTAIKYSALMVARLKPKPCVVAEFAASPNQSRLARLTADRAETLGCLQP